MRAISASSVDDLDRPVRCTASSSAHRSPDSTRNDARGSWRSAGELLGARRRARCRSCGRARRTTSGSAIGMPSRRSVVRMPVCARVEHVPRFVGGQANAHSTTGLFHARRGTSVKATSASPCARAWSTTILIASGVGSGQLWKSTIASRRRRARHCSMSSIALPATRCGCSRSSSFQSYATASQSTCHQPRAATLWSTNASCSPPGREAGTVGGRARTRPSPSAASATHELVVDLLGGQLGEATVRVPMQTDEHPFGLRARRARRRSAAPSTQPPWMNRVAGACAARASRWRRRSSPRGTDGRAPSTSIVMATFTARTFTCNALITREATDPAECPHGRQRTTRAARGREGRRGDRLHGRARTQG